MCLNAFKKFGFLAVLTFCIPTAAKAEAWDTTQDLVTKINNEDAFDIRINTGLQNYPIMIFGVPLPEGNRYTETIGYSMSNTTGFVYDPNPNVLWVAKVNTPYADLLSDENYKASGLELSIGSSSRSNNIRHTIRPEKQAESLNRFQSNDLLDAVANELAKPARDKFNSSLNISAAIHRFEDAKDRNSGVLTMTPAFEYDLNNQTRISAGLSARVETANESIYNNQSFGGHMIVEHQFNQKFKANVGYQFTDRNFDTPNSEISAVARHDQESVYAFGGSLDISTLTSKDMYLNVQYQYISNDSNASAYGYERQVTLLTLTKQW
jgi:hypothetical protein